MPQDLRMPEGKFIASVKIGPKGQIVIPKEVRDMFGFKPGDTVVLLADVDRGIAINSVSFFDKAAAAMYQTGERGGADFNEAVKTVRDRGDIDAGSDQNNGAD